MTEVAAEVNAAVGAAKDAHDATSRLGVPAPDPSWRDRAACTRVEDPDTFFPGWGKRDQERIAKWVCRRACPVVEECLASALEFEAGKHAHDRFGVWGGLTPPQRAALDPGRRPPGGQVKPTSCPWPGTTRGLDRHADMGEDPCLTCFGWRLAQAERQQRDERVLNLAADGRTAWQIALATGEPYGTVRGILARQSDLVLDPGELVLEGQLAVGE